MAIFKFVENFKCVRSYRSDVKPEFRFYSAPLGDVVEVTVDYKAGNGRSVKRGYYIDFTTKEITADGGVIWLPFSAPRSSVLLAEAARFSLPVLVKWAERFDADVVDLAASWLQDRAAVESLLGPQSFPVAVRVVTEAAVNDELRRG
jgi:hypothetical protein